MKIIIVTGTPCTGKTVLSRKIANKLNLHYADVNKIITKYNLAESYDKKRKTKVVDINKLNKKLIREIANIRKTIKNETNKKYSKNNKAIKNKIKNGIVIDSHLSHYLPKKHADLCIVAKCGLKVLQKRLKRRKYPKEKIRENLDAEIFDVCLNEAKEEGHKVIVIDTTKGINIKAVSKQAGGLIDVWQGKKYNAKRYFGHRFKGKAAEKRRQRYRRVWGRRA